VVEHTSDGDPFGIEDPSFINDAVANAHPLSSVGEAVDNAIEAGATLVEVFPHRKKGYVIILDNGPGMAQEEIEAALAKYGAGKKERGQQKNKGAGLKAVGAYQNPNGLIASFWQSRRRAYFATLGKLSSGKHGIFKDAKGQKVFGCDVPAYDGELPSQSGAQIELTGITFEPYVIRKYLNDRYLALPETVKLVVWQKHKGDEMKSRPVRSIPDSMSEVCSETGMVRLKTCNLYWGIRINQGTDAEINRVKNFVANTFAANPLYYA